MSACTEVAIIPLKSGTDVHDPNSETGRLTAEVAQTLLEQPGMQRMWWGTEVENPSVLRLFIDWDDLQKHKDFMASVAYGPFMERMRPILSAPPTLYHINLDQHNPPNVLGQGLATEVLSIDFPGSLSADAKSNIEAEIKKFGDMASKSANGPRNLTAGWSVENDVPFENGSSDKGIKLVALLGWNSIEDHMKFRETQEFKDNIGILLGLPEKQGMNLIHVKAQAEQPRGV